NIYLVASTGIVIGNVNNTCDCIIGGRTAISCNCKIGDRFGVASHSRGLVKFEVSSEEVAGGRSTLSVGDVKLHALPSSSRGGVVTAGDPESSTGCKAVSGNTTSICSSA